MLTQDHVTFGIAYLGCLAWSTGFGSERLFNLFPIQDLSNMIGVRSIRFWLLVSAFLVCSSKAMTPHMLRASREYQDKLNHLRLADTKNDTISPQCNRSLIELENRNNSAIQKRYLDALGKPGAGILAGHFTWIGSYSECVNISDAAYCLVGIGLKSNGSASQSQMNPFASGFKIGLCVPKTCSEADIATGIKDIIKGFGLKSYFRLVPDIMTEGMAPNTKTVHCAKQSEFTDGVILTITFCSVILAFCFCGTLIDLISGPGQSTPPSSHVRKSDGFMPVTTNNGVVSGESESFVVRKNEAENMGMPHHSANESTPLILANQNKPSFILEFFRCFSLIRNTNQIMDTKVPSGAITSINGMRVLSMFWVVLGHTFLWQLIGGAVENIALEFPVVQRFTFQGILNAVYSVDSFFFLSGLLVAYLSFRHMEKSKGKLNLFQFYFHRFWRLTPAYMFVILFFDQLIGFLGEGPLWYQLQTKQPCDKYWWTNLLYINNFYPTEMQKMCMGWSWYLANDMQFYVISPVLILLAYRFGKKGLLVSVGSLLLGGFISTATIIGYYDFQSGSLLANAAKQAQFQNYVYIKPYCRIAPYLVGIALGYVFHVIKDDVSRPPRWWFLILGWCAAIVLALAPVYGTYKTVRKDNPIPFTKAENIMYGTFSRFSWGLALAWVVYVCHIGYGGIVNKILSARFWIPLSRLTYTVYLVHPIVLSAYFASTQTTMYYSDVNISWHFIATTAVSYVVGFMVSVTLEVPMMHLEKLIFKTHRKH